MDTSMLNSLANSRLVFGVVTVAGMTMCCARNRQGSATWSLGASDHDRRVCVGGRGAAVGGAGDIPLPGRTDQ